jgi:hypothetical protein
MRSPTSREPVKAITCVRGSRTSASPIEAPPGQRLTTPSGMPTSFSKAKKRAAITGVSGEGLSTAVFPQTIAADNMPVRIASGKFHGGKITATPRG